MFNGIPAKNTPIDCLVFFGLSALRFIVAVCFFFDFSACIRLLGSLSLNVSPTRKSFHKLVSVSPAFED